MVILSGQDEDLDVHSVFILYKPFQCFMIFLIFVVTVVSNCSIILNISQSNIKSSMVSFIIIKHLCIVDLCGALAILPVPFIATFGWVHSTISRQSEIHLIVETV